MNKLLLSVLVSISLSGCYKIAPNYDVEYDELIPKQDIVCKVMSEEILNTYQKRNGDSYIIERKERCLFEKTTREEVYLDEIEKRKKLQATLSAL